MNELHPNWKKEANDRINPDIKENSLGKAINNGKKQSFIQGATLMRDRVEKMLKDKEAEVNKDFVFTDEDEYRQLGKLSLLEELLFDLKNITPNE